MVIGDGKEVIMSRCFRVLGLEANATKEQVKAAYARKVARLKGPDYAEDQEYVHRKLMELKGAYEEALRLAGDGGYVSAAGDASASKSYSSASKTSKSTTTAKSTASTRLRDAERSDDEHNFSEKFHQWLESRDDNKARKSNKKARKTEGGNFGAKLSELKPSELNLPGGDKLKNAWEELKTDLLADDENDSSMENTVRIDEEGTIVTEKKKSDKGGEIILKLAVAIFAICVSLFGACEDDSVSYEDYDEDYVEYEYEYDDIGNYDDISDLDLQIRGIAEASNEYLYAQPEYAYASWMDEKVSAYMPQASRFARNYWGMESIEDVSDYLCNEYEGYTADSSLSLDQQLDAIFAFYDFMGLEEAAWYRQPYTESRIEGYANYLYYLNQYYEEMMLE